MRFSALRHPSLRGYLQALAGREATLLWTGGTWPTGVPPGGGEGTAMLQGALQCGGVLLAAHNSGRPVGVGATFDLFQVL